MHLAKKKPPNGSQPLTSLLLWGQWRRMCNSLLWPSHLPSYCLCVWWQLRGLGNCEGLSLPASALEHSSLFPFLEGLPLYAAKRRASCMLWRTTPIQIPRHTLQTRGPRRIPDPSNAYASHSTPSTHSRAHLHTHIHSTTKVPKPLARQTVLPVRDLLGNGPPPHRLGR